MEPLAVALMLLPFVCIAAWKLIVTDRDGLQAHRGTFVLIQLETTSVRGVLTGLHRDAVALAEAVELSPQADVEVGSVVIPRSRIAYVQVGEHVAADALRLTA